MVRFSCLKRFCCPEDRLFTALSGETFDAVLLFNISFPLSSYCIEEFVFTSEWIEIRLWNARVFLFCPVTLQSPREHSIIVFFCESQNKFAALNTTYFLHCIRFL